MFDRTNHLTFTNRAWRLLGLCCLVGMFSAILAAPAYAEPPVPAGVEPCESCHSTEAEAWMASPHANVPTGADVAGATCKACHGTYVKGHPENGIEMLQVDSSTCQDCHAETFIEWQDTIHAGADVQCIGCHQSHSQQLRLTDEQLCRACHEESLEDPFHSAHWYTEVACIDCHLASTPVAGALAMAGSDAAITRASHDFTTVSADKCLDCHRGDVANPSERLDAQQLALVELRTQTQQVAELDAHLEQAQQTANTLQVMTPVALGFGLGIGGMLGIIFMLVIAHMERKTGEK